MSHHRQHHERHFTPFAEIQLGGFFVSDGKVYRKISAIREVQCTHCGHAVFVSNALEEGALQAVLFSLDAPVVRLSALPSVHEMETVLCERV
jgi:hypothetical protein